MQFDKAYLESLYAQAELYLVDNPYIDAVTKDSFYTKVVGVTMEEGRQEAISFLTQDSPIFLIREPSNEHDPNAIAVYTEAGEKIGYLKRQLALALAARLDAGEGYHAAITAITGGVEDHNYGCNIIIYKDIVDTAVDWPTRARLTCLKDGQLKEAIRRAVLGDYHYHQKQLEALAALYEGHNTLAIFGTGRGKSAIFQTVTAYKAIRASEVTIIVYPLRALANDQFISMQAMFGSLGLRIYRANGSLGSEERLQVFDALKSGEVDVLLTTPEFLLFHKDKLFVIKERIGLFVVDESHHIADLHRPAYRRLAEIQSLLGNPQTLAVTATANDDVAREIVQTLNIEEMVVDDFERANLDIVDLRNHKQKETYLLTDISRSASKSVVYVGTRKEAVRLAQTIREKNPKMADSVAFYHGGMNAVDRAMVEGAFRSGELKAIVATCAFGEGINIPDVSNVYLMQMNFSLTEFNQMAGRCGRNGANARIHVMFGFPDGILNQHILKNQAPDRETVAYVYQAIKSLPGQVKNAEIAGRVLDISNKQVRINETGVSASLGILEELGLIIREVEDGKRTIILKKNPARTDIDRSIRYQEGQQEFAEFLQFRSSILNMTQDELLQIVRHPICPQRNIVKDVSRVGLLAGVAWLD